MNPNPLPVTVPAPNDVMVAWPEQPQQLFLLLHGAGQRPAAMREMAQQLADAFPDGLVACLAAPHQHDDGEGFQWYSERGENDENLLERVLPARDELMRTLQAWQQASGLGPERTALVAFGQSGMLALEAVVASEAVATRLFAVACRFATLPDAMHVQTTLHWLHGKADTQLPFQAATEAAYRLRALDADFSVDIYPETGHEFSAEMQQRVLHLLRNHVPLRIWREAMQQSGRPPADDDEAPRIH